MGLPQTTVLLSVLLFSSAQAETLEGVLARMDKAASGFRTMTASVTQKSFTAVLNEATEASGTIALERVKQSDLRMLVTFTQPDAKSVFYEGRKLQIYYPKIQTVQEFDLGKQSGLIDQFLLLGFGTPGSELAKSYDLKYLGEEAINGVPAWRLELTPKSQEALKHVKKLEIWISQADNQPVQQKVFQPSRDYILITYSDLKINPTLPPNTIKLNVPKGVKKEYPQK